MNHSRWPLWLQERKYLLLLASLLLVLVAYPVVRGIHPTARSDFLAQQIFNGFFAVMLLAALSSVIQKRRMFLLGLLLGIPAILLIWSTYLAGNSDRTALDLLLGGRLVVDMLFLALVVGCVLYDVLESGDVTSDKLCGAISVYLLLGMIWALIYTLIHHCDAGAFKFHEEVLKQVSVEEGELRHGTFSLMVYYSFVTLSTLGYGDITPVAPSARVFAWLEAVTGQLFLAVLIARLVGLHIAHAKREGDRPELPKTRP